MKNEMSTVETQGAHFHAMTKGQLLTVAAIGVLFWFGGAMSVRFATPLGFFGPVASLLAYLVALPIGWLGVILIAKAARLRRDQIVPGIAVGTAAATFCDGIALTWAPWLYGTGAEEILYGAAWILWGVFTFFVAAIFEATRTSRQSS